jgi:hypothetical protein
LQRSDALDLRRRNRWNVVNTDGVTGEALPATEPPLNPNEMVDGNNPLWNLTSAAAQLLIDSRVITIWSVMAFR